MNLRTFWETKVGKNREKIFLYYEDEKISYSKFDAKVNQAANVFLGMGVK